MKFQKLIIVLFVLSLASIVIVSVPKLKRAVKESLLDDKRVILGKVQGSVIADGPSFVILKIKQRDEIFVEIYKEEDKSEALNFIQKLEVSEKNEGSFTFHGELTNLAFADIDEDGYKEILVPVFNSDMTARLYTFKFNSASNLFDVFSSK